MSFFSLLVMLLIERCKETDGEHIHVFAVWLFYSVRKAVAFFYTFNFSIRFACMQMCMYVL